ncbi:MAG: GNAT family N-acetyltransferase [Rhodobacteraceae bacterium]|nr:GNAT family N-acetyltransferase [Paracoccaceae bacterium]
MIERATLADAAACSAILHEWIYEHTWFPNHAPESASEQSMRSRIEEGAVYVSRNQTETDGFIAFSKGYLDCLYLTPEARNHGLGARLLEKAKAESPQGLSLWVLEKNKAAVRFYMREGFSETARGDGSDNEEGMPDIQMEWPPKEVENGKPA